MCLGFLFCFLGKYFWKSGDRHEGEFKDGNVHGQGKKSYLLNDFYWFWTLSNAFLGEYFWNSGDRYEGEWRDNNIHG